MAKKSVRKAGARASVRKYSSAADKYQRMKPLSVKGERPYFDSELAIDEAAIYKRMKLVPYTPDKLLSKKKIDVLNDMMLDSEIEAAIDELKLIRMSSGWEVEAASDSPRDREIRDFVEYNLEHVEGSFDDDLREIMGAVEMGVSINELIWYSIESGKYAKRSELGLPMVGLSSIKSKNPKYFNLYTDDFDNLQEQGVVNISSLDYGRQYPVNKFIIYSFNKRYENIFGTSRIRTLYDLWFIKQVCIRAWGIYLEKFGHPFPVIKHAAGIGEKERNYLLNILKQIRYETGFTVPKEVEVDMLEDSGKAGEAHERAMTWLNTQIRKKIMGQGLTSDAGEKGARALGEVHFDILMFYVEHLGKDVQEKAVNKQLIERLVDYNYPDVEEYPKFQFKPLIQEDVQKNIDTYYSGVEKQVIKPIPEDEEKIREYLNFPARRVEDTPSAAVFDPSLPGKAGTAAGAKEQSAPQPQSTAQPPAEEAVPGSAAMSGDDDADMYSEHVAKYADKIFSGTNRRKFTTYEEVVDFAEIKQSTQSVQDKYVIKLGTVIKDGINGMMKNIQKNDIVGRKDFEAIKNISFYADATGALKTIFSEMLKEVFDKSQVEARREIIGKKRQARKYAEVVKFQYEMDLRKITPNEALAFLDAKAFDMAGIERNNITDKVKVILYNAIKTGATTRDTINQIQSDMEEYYKAGEVEDEALKGARLETVVRTNITEAMNEGRKMFFEAPELDGYVVAYQYSAVLDDRVRPNHACMDGRIYPVTSPVWDTHTPPNGFNCRCLLIPITADEEWEESPMPPKSCDPDEGFSKPGR